VSALVLAVLLSQLDAGVGSTADGGFDCVLPYCSKTPAIAPFASSLYSTCPDAPLAMTLDGGWVLMPPERSARVACLMMTCETDRLQKEDAAKLAPPPMWWVVGISAVVTAGAVAFGVGRATAPAAPTPPSP